MPADQPRTRTVGCKMTDSELNLGYSSYANGQMQQITNNLDGLKTEKYTYDELLRLLTAQRGPDTNLQREYSYDYDRFGNRWGQNVVAGSGFGGTNSFDYASNRVTSTGFSYDNSGNLTANGPVTSFTFNPENFLTAAGASITYTVDTLGRRSKKTVSGTTTNYFYSGSVVISELQGTTRTDYVFFGDQRIAQQSGSTLSPAKFLHSDHLKSTRVCTDGNGNSLGSCDYEPFGEFQPGSACPNLPSNFRFAGMQYESETGQYYTSFRQYDPNQGRWMSVDPLAGSALDPRSLDRYAYVRNDPLNLIDPLGLGCRDEEVWVFVDVPVYVWNGEYWQQGWRTIWQKQTQRRCEPERLGDRDGGGGGGGGSTVGQTIKAAVGTAVKTVVCSVTQPLQDLALSNRGVTGVGAGGSAGIAPIPFFGVAVEGSVQLVADPRGNVGIAFSGGYNPGAGVFGAGAVGGAQFTNSTAPTIFDLRGPSFAASASAGKGAGGGIEVTRSMSSPVTSLTVTVGGAIGTKGAAFSLVGAAVPNALSVSCR